MSHLHSQAIPHLIKTNSDAKQQQFLLFTPQGANHIQKNIPSSELYQQQQQYNSSGKLIQQGSITGSSIRHGVEEPHIKSGKNLNNPISHHSDLNNQQQLTATSRSTNALPVSEMSNYFFQNNPQFPSSNHQSGNHSSDKSKQFQSNSTAKINTSQPHPYISMLTPSTAAADDDKFPSSQNKYLRQNQEVSRFNLSSSSTPPVHFSTPKTEGNTAQANLACHLHPSKRVKYQKRNNSKDKFCSSCAVEFAGQGIPIQEIAKSSTSKESQMSSFLAEMTKVQRTNESLMQNFEKKLQFIKDECLKQTQIIHEFFSAIETALFAQKVELLNKLNTHMWEAINVIEQKRNEALIHEKRFLRNTADIEKNRSRILAEMNSSKVHSILSYYYEELDQTKKNITEIYSSTTVSLVSFDVQKLAQESSAFLKSIRQDLFQVKLCNSTLSDRVSLNTQSQSSPALNHLPNQLSRFMTNSEMKSPSKKNKQITPSQEGQQHKSLLSNKNKEKLPANQLEKVQTSEQGITTATDAIDVSASEKQQTQESDDLSYVPLIEQNYSKVSNKSNISQNQIISYSDIHDEPLSNIYLPKKCSIDPTDRRNSKHIQLQLPQQQSLSALSLAFQSPQSQNNQTDSSIASQQLSENKAASYSKFRQGVSTDPTAMLPSNKNKSVNYNNKQGFQRNLLISELTDCQREQKRISTSTASQQLPFSLASYFEKHKFGNILYNENPHERKELTSSNNLKPLQFNYLEDKQQPSLPSHTENKSPLSNTTLFSQSSRSNNNVTSHLKQQLNHKILNNFKNCQPSSQAYFSDLSHSQSTIKS